MLRFMAWLCLRNDDYQSSQMVIVTGPNQELAIKLIKRMKALFTNLGITFDTKETVLELNGCSIEAYPSNPEPPICTPNGPPCPPCPEGVEAGWCADDDEIDDFDCGDPDMENDPK